MSKHGATPGSYSPNTTCTCSLPRTSTNGTPRSNSIGTKLHSGRSTTHLRADGTIWRLQQVRDRWCNSHAADLAH